MTAALGMSSWQLGPKQSVPAGQVMALAARRTGAWPVPGLLAGAAVGPLAAQADVTEVAGVFLGHAEYPLRKVRARPPCGASS